MKRFMLALFTVVMVAMPFIVACKGGSESPDEDAGQTKFSFENGVLKVTNAYLGGRLYDLVNNDGAVESVEDSAFDSAVLMGGSSGSWKILDIVSYSGGANVSFSGGKAGYKVNIYFRDPTKSGQDGEYWEDLGKAACIKGCKIVLEKEHDSHYILLED